MGRLIVTTWLKAHRAHIPPAAWHRRQDSWTPETSAAGWERHLRERDADPAGARACYLIAEDPAGPLSTLRYEGCAAGAEVRLIRIDGLGHRWTHDEVDTTAVIWQFFKAHPLKP